MHPRLMLLTFALIIGFSFAAIEPLNLQFAVPIVAIIVVIFLALSNMMSTALSDPRLQAWAKTELREFFAALLLITIITAAFLSSTGVSRALTGESDYVEKSQQIVDKWIDNYDSAFQYLVRAGSKIRSSATYSPYINIPAYWVSFSYSGNPIGGAAILLVGLNIAGQAISNVTFLYEGLRLLVLYLKITIPQVFLPLAFVLRLIPFTRKTGNTLIAIGLAGIVFLPFGIILADSLNTVIGSGFPEPKIANIGKLDANPWAMVAMAPLCESKVIRLMMSLTDPLFAVIVCLPLLLVPIAGPGLFNACKPIVEFVVYPIIQVVFQLVMAGMLTAWSAYYAAAGGEQYAKDAIDVLYPFLRDVNNLALIGYLDFILIAIITISGAKSLSAALGGEWYMAGIQRLI